MATIYGDDIEKPKHMTSYGNAWAEDFTIAKAASGATDKLVLGIIPAGIRVNMVDWIFEDCGTGVSLGLGYEPVDDVPVASAAYWFSAVDVATAAGRTLSSALPITFEKPVRLIATLSGAAFTGTPRITVLMSGKVVGVR